MRSAFTSPFTSEGAARVFVEKALYASGRAQYHALVEAARRAFGLEYGDTTVDGCRVPFFVGGWGPATILVHGFGSEKESWLGLMRLLRRGRRTVIALDLPGFGHADPIPPARATARAQAMAVARVMDACGFAKATLVGSSMGGSVVLRLAYDEPSRVRALVLVGSVGPRSDESPIMERIERGDNPLVAANLQQYRELIRLVTERNVSFPRPMLDYLAAKRGSRRDLDVALFEGWRRTIQSEGGIPTALDRITAPALVIQGKEDRVIPRVTAEALAAELPHARLELLEGVGHLPHAEAPRRVARLIEAFLSSPPPS